MMIECYKIPHQYRNKYYQKTNLTISKTDSTKIYNIPTNVSQLVNDSNYATKGYVDQVVASKASVEYVDNIIQITLGDFATALKKIIGE